MANLLIASASAIADADADKALDMSTETKENSRSLVKFGDLVCNLDFCSFSIRTETKEVMDPYDLTKTVTVKFHVLRVIDAVTQTTSTVKLINPDDPTVKLICAYLKAKGIILNVAAGKFAYPEESVA